MPFIRGRYYANPAYGEAMERAREREDGGEPPREGEHASADDAHHGRVHHIHIQRHADGVRVHVHHHGPGSDDEHPAPSGHWFTHNFDHGDHEAIGHFVASVSQVLPLPP